MIVYMFVILPAMYRRQLMEGMWYLAGAEVIMMDAPIVGWMLMLFLKGVGFYGY